MSDLQDQLEKLKREAIVPMHMPGAKRNSTICNMGNPYDIDITEIDGFDNLHCPNGIIKDGFKKAAQLFGAKESFYLINGSSSGILSAVCGATNRGDQIIIARNVHCSVINAVYLNELKPLYVYPSFAEANCGICGGINPDDILQLLKGNQSVSAVVVTSPTYEGNVSDIKKIAKITHQYGAILIVDEAHGAHFNFHKAFPESAVHCDADIVIQSIHKTLPALTQTALLHICSNRVNIEKIKIYWHMFQTTSPSYVLMASIDRCVTIIAKEGKKLYDEYIQRLMLLRCEIKKLHFIKLIETDDISKIVLCVKDGKALYNQLKDFYHIQLEMASLHYVIAMTSVCDTDENYKKFLNALKKLDTKEAALHVSLNKQYFNQNQCIKTNSYITIYDAINRASSGDCESVDLKDSVGRTACRSICFYPPGINIINPGEIITEEVIEYILAGIKHGLEAIGLVYNNEAEINGAWRLKGDGVQILCLK